MTSNSQHALILVSFSDISEAFRIISGSYLRRIVAPSFSTPKRFHVFKDTELETDRSSIATYNLTNRETFSFRTFTELENCFAIMWTCSCSYCVTTKTPHGYTNNEYVPADEHPEAPHLHAAFPI